VPTLRQPLVLLVPAAGYGRRLGLDTHKATLEVDGEPAGGRLLRAAADAGIGERYLVVRPTDADLARRLGDPGARAIAIEPTASVPETVARGLASLADDTAIALGFPDVLYEPADALTTLVETFGARADLAVLLGLFPTDRPDKADMVECAAGRVTRILVKPGACALGRTWLLALWRPPFSRFLAAHLAHRVPSPHELQLSDVLNAAIAAGLAVGGLDFPGGSHLDIGTPEDLERARRRARAAT
jgi:glucose-1-phosphate thymidylyltransferase